MRNYTFPLAAALTFLIACSSQAAEKPRPAQGNQNQSKKIWTNEDLDQLHSRGLISIVGLEAPAPASLTNASATTVEPTFPIYTSRLNDPAWYADEAASLQDELDKRTQALHQQQAAIALAADRITQPGIALNKSDAGLTPAAGVANLEAQVQEVQNQLDELSDLARQHNIQPGVLRS